MNNTVARDHIIPTIHEKSPESMLPKINIPYLACHIDNFPLQINSTEHKFNYSLVWLYLENNWIKISWS